MLVACLSCQCACAPFDIAIVTDSLYVQYSSCVQENPVGTGAFRMLDPILCFMISFLKKLKSLFLSQFTMENDRALQFSNFLYKEY